MTGPVAITAPVQVKSAPTLTHAKQVENALHAGRELIVEQTSGSMPSSFIEAAGLLYLFALGLKALGPK
jgi:hypothetical protein